MMITLLWWPSLTRQFCTYTHTIDQHMSSQQDIRPSNYNQKQLIDSTTHAKSTQIPFNILPHWKLPSNCVYMFDVLHSLLPLLFYYIYTLLTHLRIETVKCVKTDQTVLLFHSKLVSCPSVKRKVQVYVQGRTPASNHRVEWSTECLLSVW